MDEWKNLTDEEINKVWYGVPDDLDESFNTRFARAIEAALRTKNSGASHAEKDALQDAINSIYVYANDTLSGRTDGPDDRAWYRAGIVELRNRARALATIGGAVAARAALRAKNSGEQA